MAKKVRKLKNSVKKQSPKYLLWFLIAYPFIIAVFFFGGDNAYFRLRELQEKQSYLQSEIDHLTNENRELQSKIEMAKNDPFWTEKIGREELDLVRDGEIVFKIVDKNKK